jgi:hypothetical protein
MCVTFPPAFPKTINSLLKTSRFKERRNTIGAVDQGSAALLDNAAKTA